MRVALLAIGLLSLLHFLLAFWVSVNRRRARMSVGCPEDANHPLARAIKAHSNAAEYGPILALQMLALELLGAPNWVVWVFGAAVCARCLHAVGMLNFRLDRSNTFRFLGAVGTYLTGLAMAIILVVQVLLTTPAPR